MGKWVRAAALCVLVALAAATPARAEFVLGPGSNYIIDAKINGRPVRLKVDFNAHGWVMINPAVAARVGLNGSMIKFGFKIGTEKVHLNSSLTSLEVPGRRKGRRIFWFDRNVSDDADGIISPVTLPDDVVTLQFHAPATNERTIELEAVEEAFRGLYHPMELGGRKLSVMFAPFDPRNVATAATGAHLADQLDGHWAGAPEPVRILLGIKRPGRPMMLRRPLTLSELSVASFLVRTADYRGDFQLPPEEAKDADEDEIVVTAKTSNGRARLWFSLGRETLGRCSSLSHDKVRKLFVLRCAG